MKKQTSIISVVGARPNFMKLASFIRAVDDYNRGRNSGDLRHLVVHTGQHYDYRMSESFFRELGIREPEYNLGVGSGTHARQTGQTMMAFEKVLLKEKPDWIVVYGDVNATLACSLTARKMNIKCCHIEAGLRSGDMTMPEEVNRIVTDHVSDLLLAPDGDSMNNLLGEGISGKKVMVVGNIMVDTLDRYTAKAGQISTEGIITSNILAAIDATVKENEYAVITLHRQATVDNDRNLTRMADLIVDIASTLKVVWPLHPRTHKKLTETGLFEKLSVTPGVIILHPVTYFEMIRLLLSARIILTDSGGLQVESSVLGTPCITMRENTEWTVTLRSNGGNAVLAGTDPVNIRQEFYSLLERPRVVHRPPLWDGRTAERCVGAIMNFRGHATK
jgi:UDP-N-acetylglucosamine 2-epimerase (non-hydrolysing)